MMLRKLFLLFTMLGLPFASFGAAPTANVPMLQGPAPKIDGQIEPDEWKGAAVLKDFVVAGKDAGKKAENRTEVYLLRDKSVLYIGARCFDSEMDKLSTKDWFEIFLSDPEYKIYYHFYLFSGGGKGEDGSPGVFLFGAPHWQAKVSKHSDQWQVEVAIPFFNLSPDYMNSGSWGFNICRQKISGKAENSQWSHTGGYFHVPEKFGRLTGMSNLDFIPYVSVSQMIRDEKTENYKFPTYFLLNRSYYTKEKEAEFKLYLSEEECSKLGKDAYVKVSMEDESVKLPLSQQKQSVYGKISIGKTGNGKFPVTAEIVNGKNVRKLSAELVKLPPSPCEVKVNRFTRILLINEKPFIPLIQEVMPNGAHGLPDPAAPKDALDVLCRESGFNTLNFWWCSTAVAVPTCEKYDVKVFPAAVNIMASKNKKKLEGILPDYKKMVDEYSKFGNVLGYLIADEGNIGGDEKEFAKIYSYMKELDPYRPVFRNESGWTIGYGGPGGLDTTDIFCGGYGGAKSARAVSIDGIPHGKPVFLLTQAFGIPEMPRYSSARETICWVYQILISGANGAYWWGAHSGQQPVPLWKTVSQLRMEIDVLTPAFNTEPIVSSTVCGNENIVWTLRFSEGKYYFITANITKEPQKAVYTLDGSLFKSKGKAEGMFGIKSEEYDGLSVEIGYAPEERKVFTLGKK